MPNPRKNTYGYTIRVNVGRDLSDFSDITLHGSASSNVSALIFNLSASTLFIGNSTVYSSTEGITFNSGQWCYAQTLTADSFVTADAYTFHVACSASSIFFKTPDVVVSVDE